MNSLNCDGLLWLTCPLTQIPVILLRKIREYFKKLLISVWLRKMTLFPSKQSCPTPFTHDFREGKSLDSLQLAMGLNKPFPERLPDAEAFVVEFDGQGDPWKPHNWQSWTKYVLAIVRG